MTSDAPIRVSKELRQALGKMKMHKSESYDTLLRRKLSMKRSRKAGLKNRILGNLTPGKAERAVMRSDRKPTKVVVDFP